MTVTLRDVAAEVGMHPATVSRALNPETVSLVNPTTAARIQKVADRLGYAVNPVARSLKTNRSATVGVLIPDLTNPLFPPVVRGIEDTLTAAGYTALIANTDGDLAKESTLATVMRSRQVEGFIVATAMRQHPLLEKLATEGIPLVFVNRKVDGLVASTVAGDDVQGIALAVAHLVELGHTRIAHLAGPQSTSAGLIRLEQFKSSMRQHGLDPDPKLIVECERFQEEDGATGMRGLLDTAGEFTGVVAANDLLALGTYDVFAERGIHCPDDYSVIGFNDMPFIDKVSPPLTTVHVPHYQIGAEAARLLLDKLRDKQASDKSVLLPVNLRVRGSTAPPLVAR